jgi:hypothetical protein
LVLQQSVSQPLSQSASLPLSQPVTGTGILNFQVTAAGFYSDGGRIVGCYVVRYSWSVLTFRSYHGLHAEILTGREGGGR